MEIFSGFFIFIIAFILFIWFSGVASLKAKQKKAIQKKNSIIKDLEKIRDEIITVSSSEIPGKKITKVIGVVSGVSETQASTKEEFDLAEKEALQDMILNAKNMGANAITDVKSTTGNYEQQGSQWQVSQVIYIGTAVIVE
ncbi:hypothetical protein DESAMIL20_284 [Desulfurella amilsii]|jgi:uncharacterized protein YbjQ (UPF0145 family)|uniref:Heavy metal-binding domain-containing protein n=1 Tax=Desulfurella amilsii TaxID=1562698 RepID=A0A1X4XZB2_9BACT|nr:heavy metal-binding domain-containing protein [Desulfurella amilsii]OSS42854.1 hypothetical protein DESAMIL20_284 [Desulfurella amilsii]